MPGVYTDYSSGWGLHLGANGTASSPIVLRSQVRGGAVIDGQNLSDRNKGIYLDGSYNIVDGFEIRGGPNGGITIWGNYNQILNNEIHHNGNPASTSTNGKDGTYSDQSTHNNSYKANYIHDNGRAGSNLDHGLYLCGDNEVVLNNVLVRNAATGLQIAGYTTVSNMKVYNNVVAFNGTSGIILWQALNGVDIKNNIIYQNGSYGINSWDAHGSGVVIDHNLLFGNGSGDYNFVNGGSDYSYTRGTTISVAPLFVNSSSAGFDSHLGAGSPAINAGLNLSSFFTTDKDGAARAASGGWDLGAYRYGNTDTIPPTVSLNAPANNATVSGSSVTVSANATDNVGVAGVQFKLDGANLGAEDTGAPYSVMWNTTTIPNGTHTLTAVARDSAGKQTTANSVSVVVSNSTPTPLPTVTVSSADTTATEGPTDTASFTLARTGSTAGDLAVSLTFSGTATKWDDYRRPAQGDMPDTFTIPAGASTATITVMAVADNIVEGTETATLAIQPGANYSVGTPNSLSLTILDSNGGPPPGDTTSPTVSLTAPANNATVTGSSVAVSADARDNVGVVGVQFKLDGANLGAEDTGAPYSVTWNTTTIANGTHTLSVVARDAAGNQSTATALSVVVNNPNTAPKISSIANQTISAGTLTTLAFTVSDAETAASSLTVSGSSSDPALVPKSNIVFAGSGSNRTVAAIPAGTQSGTATITVTVSDGIATTSTSFLLTVNPATVPTYVYLPFEAESAGLVPPMAVASDTNAGQGQFILSSISDSGSVTFDVNIPVSGVYSIWSRVLSPDDSRDSFYVSVDGGSEDIYDTAEGTRTNAWQWTVVNGRGGTNFTTALAINPRTFRLGAGLHSIVFRARESGTGLDQILVTNDPDYVPNVVFSTTTPPVRISSIAFGTAGYVTLAWPTMPGKTYRVVYKTNLTDAAWVTLGADQTATNTVTSRSDYVVGNRFYSVITRP